MKRTIVALLLAAFAATSFAATANDTRYDNQAGQTDQHQPEVG
jgi:Ni/Co efflux regulator RcnB